MLNEVYYASKPQKYKDPFNKDYSLIEDLDDYMVYEMLNNKILKCGRFKRKHFITLAEFRDNIIDSI